MPNALVAMTGSNTNAAGRVKADPSVDRVLGRYSDLYCLHCGKMRSARPAHTTRFPVTERTCLTGGKCNMTLSDVRRRATGRASTRTWRVQAEFSDPASRVTETTRYRAQPQGSRERGFAPAAGVRVRVGYGAGCATPRHQQRPSHSDDARAD
jgi:hypothetical protein